MKQQAISNFPNNDALQVFSPLIGSWDTTGTHGMIPDTMLHGQTTFDWHESGAYICMNTSIQEAVGIPVGIAIISSDDDLGTYFMAYYDERGISRSYNVSIKDNVIKWWRDFPGFSQQYSLTISDDQLTMIGKGKLSIDGSKWEQDLDLTYKKVVS